MLSEERKYNIYINMRDNFFKNENVTFLMGQPKKESETSFMGGGYTILSF